METAERAFVFTCPAAPRWHSSRNNKTERPQPTRLRSYLCIVLGAQGAGGRAEELLEGFREVSRGAETAVVTDVDNGLVGVFDQVIGVVEPERFQVVLERNTEFPGEHRGEVFGGVVHFLSHLFGGEVFCEMLLNVEHDLNGFRRVVLLTAAVVGEIAPQQDQHLLDDVHREDGTAGPLVVIELIFQAGHKVKGLGKIAGVKGCGHGEGTESADILQLFAVYVIGECYGEAVDGGFLVSDDLVDIGGGEERDIAAGETVGFIVDNVATAAAGKDQKFPVLMAVGGTAFVFGDLAQGVGLIQQWSVKGGIFKHIYSPV